MTISIASPAVIGSQVSVAQVNGVWKLIDTLDPKDLEAVFRILDENSIPYNQSGSQGVIHRGTTAIVLNRSIVNAILTQPESIESWGQGLDFNLAVPLANLIKQNPECTVKNGVLTSFKSVRPDLTSIHDPNFRYVVGQYAEEPYPDLNPTECTRGIHSAGIQFARSFGAEDNPILTLLTELKDIIWVGDSKVRSRKCFVKEIYCAP